jgi:hypothetical protein
MVESRGASPGGHPEVTTRRLGSIGVDFAVKAQEMGWTIAAGAVHRLAAAVHAQPVSALLAQVERRAAAEVAAVPG